MGEGGCNRAFLLQERESFFFFSLFLVYVVAFFFQRELLREIFVVCPSCKRRYIFLQESGGEKLTDGKLLKHITSLLSPLLSQLFANFFLHFVFPRHNASGVSVSAWGFTRGLFGQLLFLFIIDPCLDVFRVSCSTFFGYDPAHFTVLLTRHLWPLFRPWFQAAGIGILGSKRGCKF